MLTGALAGGEVEDKLERQNWGNLVICIDPEIIGPPEEFKDKVQVSDRSSVPFFDVEGSQCWTNHTHRCIPFQALANRIKGAKLLAGHTNIPLPGEGSEAEAAKILASGVIRLERNLYDGLLAEYQRTGGSEVDLQG